VTSKEKYFLPPLDKETDLRARGFGADGSKSGGIRDPKQVDLPKMTVLFRLYNESEEKLGEWWFTSSAMAVPGRVRRSRQSFDRSGADRRRAETPALAIAFRGVIPAI